MGGESAKTLAEAAYDRLESLIVACEILPGGRTNLQALQALCGLGRTPVLDAAKRLASVRLLRIDPRSGIAIMPIDLDQEATLVPLRVEMEVIACGLATERADARDRAALAGLAEGLRAAADTVEVAEFNVVDRRLNAAILAAAREPLLERTLEPLQTLYRRTGCLYLRRFPDRSQLRVTIERHIGLLSAILAGDRGATERTVRAMLGELRAMLERVGRDVDPAELDASLAAPRAEPRWSAPPSDGTA